MSDGISPIAPPGGLTPRAMQDLVYVGFNKRVVALDRYTGELVWTWTAPQGSGYVALLIDGDRLIASVQGYTYCLDPVFGQEVWRNPLPGQGIGTPCLASVRGTTQYAGAAEDITQQQARSAAAAST